MLFSPFDPDHPYSTCSVCAVPQEEQSTRPDNPTPYIRLVSPADDSLAIAMVVLDEQHVPRFESNPEHKLLTLWCHCAVGADGGLEEEEGESTSSNHLPASTSSSSSPRSSGLHLIELVFRTLHDLNSLEFWLQQCVVEIERLKQEKAERDRRKVALRRDMKNPFAWLIPRNHERFAAASTRVMTKEIPTVWTVNHSYRDRFGLRALETERLVRCRASSVLEWLKCCFVDVPGTTKPTSLYDAMSNESLSSLETYFRDGHGLLHLLEDYKQFKSSGPEEENGAETASHLLTSLFHREFLIEKLVARAKEMTEVFGGMVSTPRCALMMKRLAGGYEGSSENLLRLSMTEERFLWDEGELSRVVRTMLVHGQSLEAIKKGYQLKYEGVFQSASSNGFAELEHLQGELETHLGVKIQAFCFPLWRISQISTLRNHLGKLVSSYGDRDRPELTEESDLLELEKAVQAFRVHKEGQLPIVQGNLRRLERRMRRARNEDRRKKVQVLIDEEKKDLGRADILLKIAKRLEVEIETVGDLELKDPMRERKQWAIMLRSRERRDEIEKFIEKKLGEIFPDDSVGRFPLRFLVAKDRRNLGSGFRFLFAIGEFCFEWKVDADRFFDFKHIRDFTNCDFVLVWELNPPLLFSSAQTFRQKMRPLVEEIVKNCTAGTILSARLNRHKSCHDFAWDLVKAARPIRWNCDLMRFVKKDENQRLSENFRRFRPRQLYRRRFSKIPALMPTRGDGAFVFQTHIDLDTFVSRLLQEAPDFRREFHLPWEFLKSIDAGFRLNETLAGECSPVGCPFEKKTPV